MRKPKYKGPNGRPELWYQDGSSWFFTASKPQPRVRVFYSSGETEWCSLLNYQIDQLCFNRIPCWYPTFQYNDGFYQRKSPKTLTQAKKLASSYDRKLGFAPMEFLGYL